MSNNFRCTDRRSDCCILCSIYIRSKSHKTALSNSGRIFYWRKKTSRGLFFTPKRTTRVKLQLTSVHRTNGVHFVMQLPIGIQLGPPNNDLLTYLLNNIYINTATLLGNQWSKKRKKQTLGTDPFLKSLTWEHSITWPSCSDNAMWICAYMYVDHWTRMLLRHVECKCVMIF